jgi:hypothetical protein
LDTDMKKLLITLCAFPFALAAPLALATVCPSSGCAVGQFCARDLRIPEGSACYPTCMLDSSGATPCNVGYRCVSVTGQGVCVLPDSPLITGGTSSTSASTPGAAPAAVPFTSITPKLGVEIPGLTLSPAIKAGETVSLPFLAQYINAAYRYMVTIVLIVSIVMVVYGGFRYLVGASMGDIKAGKKIIMDALGGMLIVLGAYMILNTINPNTLNLKVLSLEFVQFEDLEEIPVADYVAATGITPPSSQENINLAREVAVTMGIDPCEAEAVVRGESGGKANTIGYDANVPRVGVGSRRAFIKSGTTYKGIKFPVPPGEWPTIPGKRCSVTQNVNAEQLAAIQNRSIRNDDRFDPTAPPNFGLDPHYTVGIGTFQVTPLIDQSTCEMGRCPNGYIGRYVGGTCYSVPELLEPRTQTIAGLGIYKSGRDSSQCASQRDEYTRLRCAFSRIAGTGDSARVSSCRKMTYYAACKGISHHERANCRSWLNTDDAIANDFTSE